MLVLLLAFSFEDNWKDKTFTALICIQAIHATGLVLILVPASFLRRGNHRTRSQHSIRQMMMATFVAAVTIWAFRTAQPHINQVLILKHVAPPTFNSWILIVGLMLALNTMAWRVSLNLALTRKWIPPSVLVLAVMLGCGAGVLYLSINPRWDTSMQAARYAVHSGYACCFLFQGALLCMFDLGATLLSKTANQNEDATNHPMHRRTGRRVLIMETQPPVLGDR